MNKKNHFFIGKRSEYKNQYLPFDFYDFWITAKENQTQRNKNKIRDYLHTPFDWDEDQDFYIHSSSSLGGGSDGLGSDPRDSVAHESTQTTFRSRANTHRNEEAKEVKESINLKNGQNRRNKSTGISFNDEQKLVKKKSIVKPQQSSTSSASSSSASMEQQEVNRKKSKTKEKHTAKSAAPESEHRPDQHHQHHRHHQHHHHHHHHSHQNESNNYIDNATANPISDQAAKPQNSSVKKRSKKNKNKNVYKNEFQSNFLNNIAQSRNVSNFDKVLARSISNIAIQTPPAWNLREYNKEPKSKTHKSKAYLKNNFYIQICIYCSSLTCSKSFI
jgi:hypothetical protein